MDEVVSDADKSEDQSENWGKDQTVMETAQEEEVEESEMSLAIRKDWMRKIGWEQEHKVRPKDFLSNLWWERTFWEE